MEVAMEIVSKYNTSYAQGYNNNNNKLMIFERDRSEIEEYPEAEDSIIHKVLVEHTSSKAVDTVRNQLLDEFRSMLDHAFNDHHTSCDSVSANDSSTSMSTASLSFDDPTEPLLPDLRSIVQRLKAMGHLDDCRGVYKAKRLGFFRATLRSFGIEKAISVFEVKRTGWESLDNMAGLWLKLSELFFIEKQTYQSIFESDDCSGDSVFEEIISAYIKPFLDFAQAIASSNPSTHKLFRLLDLHCRLKTILSRVIPGVPRLVSHVEKVLFQLREASRKSFEDFERAVSGDITHITSVQEGVHSLTSYVMSYITRLVTEYGDDCQHIVSGPREVELEVATRFDCCSSQSPFESHVVWVVVTLIRSLICKTLQHDADDAFVHFFMINNVYYILQRMNEDAGLRRATGGDSSELRCYLESALTGEKWAFMKSSWNRIERDLWGKKIRLMGMNIFVPWRRNKEILKDFNVKFKAFHRAQSKWLACNANLARELRESTSNTLVPLYEQFLKKYLESSSSDETTAIVYSVDDVKIAISQLFRGKYSNIM